GTRAGADDSVAAVKPRDRIVRSHRGRRQWDCHSGRTGCRGTRAGADDPVAAVEPREGIVAANRAVAPPAARAGPTGPADAGRATAQSCGRELLTANTRPWWRTHTASTSSVIAACTRSPSGERCSRPAALRAHYNRRTLTRH